MRVLRNLFLGVAMSALSPVFAQAQELEIDKFLCVLESENGPTALFQSPIPLTDGFNLNDLGLAEQSYNGSSIQGDNVYTRDQDRLITSIKGYNNQAEIGLPSYTTLERHAAQTREWEQALDAIKAGTSPCLAM